jgi:lipoprotein signal peptidase
MAFLAATAVAVLADQASKAATRRPVLNRRGSIAALRLRSSVVIWSVTLTAAVLAVSLASRSLGTVGAVGLGLALGGATSNLFDRVTRGAVIDFIALWRWPAFNLADAAMVVGWALLAGSLV